MEARINSLRRIKHGSLRRLQAALDGAVFASLMVRRGTGRVVAGPFRGMRFSTHYPHGTPRALAIGTYEKELWPALLEIKARRFERFFDVGGADGYYAVGGSLIWNVGSTVVFEALAEGREAIEDHARVNGVSAKMEIRGICREEELFSLVDSEREDLLLMDVEGAEVELLSDRVCRGLRKSVVIVEAHDFVHHGAASMVAARFAGTHRVCIVSSEPRKVEDWPARMPAPKSSKIRLMDERRPCQMDWVVCFPSVM